MSLDAHQVRLDDFSPVEVAFFQAAIGALGLLVKVLTEGRESCAAIKDIVRHPLQAILLGELAISAPFILISTGELSVPSGLAGVLLSSLPMFVAVFAPRFDRSAEISRVQTAGLVVGLAGVALVVGVHAIGSLGQFLGALAILGAAASGLSPPSSSSCNTGTRAFHQARRPSSRSPSVRCW